jgi:hypothetical protein
MEWTQFVLFLIAIGGMYYSLKNDSKEDRQRAAEDRKEIIKTIRAIESESKDFHGRLCTLEERYLQIIQQKLGRE